MQYRYLGPSSESVPPKNNYKCETSNGVLGVNTGIVLTEATSRARFSKLMVDSGCYSAVRYRQNISQIGHHVVLRQSIPPRPKVYPLDMLSFIPFFLSGTIIPVVMTGDLNYSVSFYIDGAPKNHMAWSNQHREYLSIIKFPIVDATPQGEFESKRAEEVAANFLSLINKK